MILPSKSEGIMVKCRTVVLGFLCAVTCLSHSTSFGVGTSKKVKIFILAGQSNMEGKAKVELLEYQVDQPETRDFFKHLKKEGRWVERDDVWINFLDRKGKLTVGFGSPNRIGPEFKGNVKVVKTDIFWDRKAAALVKNWRDHVDEWNKVGSDCGYYYLGSAITFSKIGRAFGEAMLELMKVHK